MPDCVTCPLFQLESENETCLHVNRPGGLELTREGISSCRLPTGASILDAACGSGATLQDLLVQGYQATGLDLSLAMLKSQPRLPMILGNCSIVPLPSSSQDAVLMECALSLSNEAAGALAEFHRILRPGGWLVVTDLYIRELLDPRGLDALSLSSCISGVQTEGTIHQQMNNSGFVIRLWQDQTMVFKQWLAKMVFKLGSLNAFYRQLSSCEASAQSLENALGSEIKLGYYLMTAQKVG